ncbi:MAG: SIMPL domain-containing protein [Cyanobacteria bacterium HKST-UBA06]|nr:SIMPL domain-containing protein [Cyanobacteria bacterium HKST-UBA05]MCA9799765.1 SIMPL domain-containing protein [Cyanobacteria bacterium HKST-UBA04]MCA9807740.1 SIMPL domain-containing protein [Cyanobacteria bacterium HKST-UBA06]MCA9841779.1 SIMPL domain-containing protein [Cyanobacteria bacterium HKST-UBA03]
MVCDSVKEAFKQPLVIFGAFLTLALVVSALILSQGIMNRYADQTISVTGAASQIVTSDHAVVTLRFSREAADMQTAFKDLKRDRDTVAKFLKQQGIPDDQVTYDTISNNVVYQKNTQGYSTNAIEGYAFHQSVTVENDDPKAVVKLTQTLPGLVQQNVLVSVDSPQFFYSKLDTLKVELLRDAAKNALERARSVVEPTGRRAGAIASASTGVFQITDKNSTDVSDYGIYDTSSVDKKVTAVVNATFRVD